MKGLRVKESEGLRACFKSPFIFGGWRLEGACGSPLSCGAVPVPASPARGEEQKAHVSERPENPETLLKHALRFLSPLPLWVTRRAAEQREGGAQRRKGEGATQQAPTAILPPEATP